MKSVTFDALKVFNSRVYSVEEISRAFPLLLINTFTQFLVITEDGQWDRLYYDTSSLFYFNVNLGVAIRDNCFDYLDNIIVPFFEECFSIQNKKKYTVVFGEQEKLNFIDTCNSFKDKIWDDILNVFCEQLLLLVKSGKVNNRYLYGDN